MNASSPVHAAYLQLSAELEQAGQVPQALQVIALARKFYPQDGIFHATAGRLHLNAATGNPALQKELNIAEKHLRKALHLAGDTKPEWLGFALESYGILRLRQKRYVRAVEMLRQAEELGQTTVALRVALGDSLARSQQPGGREEALVQLEEAVRLQPACIEAWRYRGRILRELERFAESVESYTAALQHDADNAPAFAGRAETHWQNGREDLALQDLETAISLDPQYAVAYARRGAILLDLNRFEEARRDLDKSLTLEAEFASAIFNRGLLFLLTDDMAAALKDFDKALAWHGEPRALLYVYRGEVHRQMGQLTKALNDFDHAIVQDKELTAAWIGRADCYFHEEDYAAAVRDYSKAAALDPDDPWPLTQKAESFLLQGQPQKGLDYLHQAMEGQKDNAFACWTFGRLHLALKNFDTALDWFNRAIACDGDMAGLFGARGEALQRLGRYEDSLPDLQKALNKWPESDWLCYDLSLSYRLMGKQEESSHHLQEAIKRVQERHDGLAASDFGRRFNLALYHLASGQEKRALSQYKRVLNLAPPIRYVREASGDLQNFIQLCSGGQKAKQALMLLEQTVCGNGVGRRVPD